MVEPDRDGQGPDAERTPGQKSPDAFRTISEVSTDLDIPQHVLRFWEGKFTQIRPLKRAGGRRYYRPDDVELLRGIQHLLYGEGYTIKGVQKILREQGVRHVVGAGRREDEPPRRSAAPPAEDVIVEERDDAILDQGEPEIDPPADGPVDELVEPVLDEVAREEPAAIAETDEGLAAEAAPGVGTGEPHAEPAPHVPASEPDIGTSEPDETIDPQAVLDDALPDEDFEPIYASGPPPREPDERGRIEPTFDPLPLPAQQMSDLETGSSADMAADEDGPRAERAHALPNRIARARAVLEELEALRADYRRRLSEIRATP